jgi:hypothetical protein
VSQKGLEQILNYADFHETPNVKACIMLFGVHPDTPQAYIRCGFLILLISRYRTSSGSDSATQLHSEDTRSNLELALQNWNQMFSSCRVNASPNLGHLYCDVQFCVGCDAVETSGTCDPP